MITHDHGVRVNTTQGGTVVSSSAKILIFVGLRYWFIIDLVLEARVRTGLANFTDGNAKRCTIAYMKIY